MASSLRLITYNLVTRSFGRPVVVSSSRSLALTLLQKMSSLRWFYPPVGYRDRSEASNNGGIMTMFSNAVDQLFLFSNKLSNESWLISESGLRSLSPIISKITFSSYLSDYVRSFDLHMHGLDSNEHQHVFLKAEHKALPKQGKKNRYLIRPTKMRSDIKEKMKVGMVTLPNKDHLMANIGASIIASFNDISAKYSWCYYDMFFDRSILGRELCPKIAKPSSINSFSMHKKEDAGSLCISMDIPGNGKMKLTTRGLTMSLEMQGVKRERVKTFFDYDTFFIEGKSKSRHYITGVHLPEGIHKKHNMIKRTMKDGVFYANIPCCVKKEELREIKDQLDQAKSLNQRTNF